MNEIGRARTDSGDKFQNIQIISVKIDAEKLDGVYYMKLKNRIKKQVKENDLLLINLIPKKPIESRSVLKTFLDLQLEFTKVVVIPQSTLKPDDIDDWVDFFRPNQILRHVI